MQISQQRTANQLWLFSAYSSLCPPRPKPYSLLSPHVYPPHSLNQQPDLSLKWSPLSNPKPKTGITAIKNSATTPATDRLISTVAYTLPFLSSLQYSRYLFIQYSNLGLLFDQLLPLLKLYRSMLYTSFVAFFALYSSVVRKPSLSHYVLFKSMQAITLDVLLVVPLLLTRIFNPGRGGIRFMLMIWGATMRCLFSVAFVLFMDWLFFVGKDFVLGHCR